MKDFPNSWILYSSIYLKTEKSTPFKGSPPPPPRIGHYKGPPSGVQDESQCFYQQRYQLGIMWKEMLA